MAAASAAVLRGSSFSPRFGAFIRPTIRFGRRSALPCRSGGGVRSLLCRFRGSAVNSVPTSATPPFGGTPFLHGPSVQTFSDAFILPCCVRSFPAAIYCSAENSCLWDLNFTLFSHVFGSLMQRPHPSLCRSPFVILPFAACRTYVCRLSLCRVPELCATRLRRRAMRFGRVCSAPVQGCGLTGRCRIPPGEGCRRRCARCPAASGAPVPAVPVLRAASPRPRPASAQRAGRARWRPRPRR